MLPFFAAAGAGPGLLSTPSDPPLLLLSGAVAEDASAAVDEEAIVEGSAEAGVSPVAVAAVEDLGDNSKAAGIATTADDRRASKFKSS